MELKPTSTEGYAALARTAAELRGLSLKKVVIHHSSREEGAQKLWILEGQQEMSSYYTGSFHTRQWWSADEELCSLSECSHTRLGYTPVECSSSPKGSC